jgi:hypothetical protein
VEWHPRLVRAALPEQLGPVVDDSRAAARSIVGSLGLSGPGERRVGQFVSGFIPISRAQWIAVLWDAEFVSLQRRADRRTQRIVAAESAPDVRREHC